MSKAVNFSSRSWLTSIPIVKLLENGQGGINALEVQQLELNKWNLILFDYEVAGRKVDPSASPMDLYSAVKSSPSVFLRPLNVCQMPACKVPWSL